LEDLGIYGRIVLNWTLKKYSKDWIYLAENRIQWRSLVCMEMNLLVSWISGSQEWFYSTEFDSLSFLQENVLSVKFHSNVQLHIRRVSNCLHSLLHSSKPFWSSSDETGVSNKHLEIAVLWIFVEKFARSLKHYHLIPISIFHAMKYSIQQPKTVRCQKLVQQAHYV
jgi:hypothetical protein